MTLQTDVAYRPLSAFMPIYIWNSMPRGTSWVIVAHQSMLLSCHWKTKVSVNIRAIGQGQPWVIKFNYGIILRAGAHWDSSLGPMVNCSCAGSKSTQISCSVWAVKSSMDQPALLSASVVAHPGTVPSVRNLLSHSFPSASKSSAVLQTHEMSQGWSQGWSGNGHQIYEILPKWTKISIIELQIIWNITRFHREVSLHKASMEKPCSLHACELGYFC